MSGSTPPPGAVARLQVWPTVIEGLGLVWAERGALAKLALWPLLLSLAADFVLAASVRDPGVYSVMKVLLLNLVWVLFAVAWLRLILLQDRRTARGLPELKSVYGRFTLYTLVIALFDVALAIGRDRLGNTAEEAFTPALDVNYWLAFLAIAYVKLRLSFVYPAVAAGETYSLPLAWRHSAGSGLQLFAAQFVAVFVPVILLSMAISHAFLALAAHPLGGGGTFLIWLLSHIVLWPLEAAYLTIIAVAFRRCTGWVPPADQAIVERFE